MTAGAHGRWTTVGPRWLHGPDAQRRAGLVMVVHASAPGELVPEWYRWACLVYDVVAAGYLFRLHGLVSRPITKPTP